MKTAQDIIGELLDSAVNWQRSGQRVTGYLLNADDYETVRDHLNLAGKANAKNFSMHTASGVVEVRPGALLARGVFVAECRPNADDYAGGCEALKPAGIQSGVAMRLELDERNRFSITGKFRVYFNRHGAEPLMWCVAPDAGNWEIAVRDVGISTHAETVYRKKETPDEDDGRPSAWFAVEGVLTVNAAGFATIGSP